MSRLWKWINEKDFSTEGKISIFFILNSLLYSFGGLLVWLLVSRFTLTTLEAAICFVGYPGFFIGFVGGFLYLCRQ